MDGIFLEYRVKIPEPQNSISALIDAAHEQKKERPRPHMGASMLGHHCDRWLWISFRWAVQPKFPGRMLRLFRRGQMEEETIVSDLRSIGVEVSNTGADQSRVDFGCHVSGSIDGIIQSGVPEAPNKPHILECKTHSKKSFDDLVKNGVEKSKPLHWVQTQVYMHGTKTDRALYYAICKDDDRIHTERVRYDKAAAERAIDRGKRIALANRIPSPCSSDPSWYQCKFCDAYKFCHQKEPTKHVNCRTCAHATPMLNGKWRCERHDADKIPTDFQHIGCEDHLIHPDMVPWPAQAGDDGKTITFTIDEKQVTNGKAAPGVYSSTEILSCDWVK